MSISSTVLYLLVINIHYILKNIFLNWLGVFKEKKENWNQFIIKFGILYLNLKEKWEENNKMSE